LSDDLIKGYGHLRVTDHSSNFLNSLERKVLVWLNVRWYSQASHKLQHSANATTYKSRSRGSVSAGLAVRTYFTINAGLEVREMACRTFDTYS